MPNNTPSLRPSEAVEGGGLLDDVDGTIVDAKWAMFAYGGKAQPAPGLVMLIEHLQDGKVTESEQFWSCGAAKDWQPSRDGKSITSPTKTQFVKSSNAIILTNSIVAAGFPEDKIGIDPSVFVGMDAHWLRVANPGRNVEGKESSTLCVQKINKLPWEAKGKAGAKAGAKAAAADDGEFDEALTDHVMTAIADAGGSISKKDLTVAVFKLGKGPNAKAFMDALKDDTFLKQDGAPWTYEKGVISIG